MESMPGPWKSRIAGHQAVTVIIHGISGKVDGCRMDVSICIIAVIAPIRTHSRCTQDYHACRAEAVAVLINAALVYRTVFVVICSIANGLY
jgi:hypothetical protein